MQRLQSTITGDIDRWRQQGIVITEWGPNVWTGQELVSVYGLTSADGTQLDSAYGAANLLLEDSQHSVGAIGTNLADRQNDYQPWNGGDFIEGNDPYKQGYVDDCTSGFGAHNGNNYYLIIAAHCYATGEAISNYSTTLLDNGTDPGSDAQIGTVGAVDNSYGGLDAELINTPNSPLYPTAGSPGSSPALFTGPSQNPQVADDSGFLTSPPGYQVCADGAYEGEICGLVVQNDDICINLGLDNGTTRYTCDEDYATNPSGGVANGQGDSGGPVFRFNGSLLESTGIISAGGTQVACTQFNATGRLCFSDIYFVDMGPILNEFNLTLNT